MPAPDHSQSRNTSEISIKNVIVVDVDYIVLSVKKTVITVNFGLTKGGLGLRFRC